MIRQLLVGIARALFAASILVSMFAIGLGYLAYRVIRFAIRGDKPYPVREAAFGALVAGVVLAKAVQAEQARRPKPEPIIYLEDEDDAFS